MGQIGYGRARFRPQRVTGDKSQSQRRGGGCVHARAAESRDAWSLLQLLIVPAFVGTTQLTTSASIPGQIITVLSSWASCCI